MSLRALGLRHLGEAALQIGFDGAGLKEAQAEHQSAQNAA